MPKKKYCRTCLLTAAAAVLVTALAAVLLVTCSDGGRQRGVDSTAAAAGTVAAAAAEAALSYPYRITATTGMVADIVRQVAGDRGEVTSIIGEGVDPHLYVPERGFQGLLSHAAGVP